jgi:hypothetical protein
MDDLDRLNERLAPPIARNKEIFRADRILQPAYLPFVRFDLKEFAREKHGIGDRKAPTVI